MNVSCSPSSGTSSRYCAFTGRLSAVPVPGSSPVGMFSGGSAVFTGSVLGGSAVASACAELSGVDSFGAVPDCSDWLVWLVWLDWLGWLPGDVMFPVQPVSRSSADSIAIIFFI